MKRKLIIAASIIFLLIIMSVGVIQTVNKPSDTDHPIKESTDPVTGEKIVDVEGKSPETGDGLGGPTMLGLIYIQPLFGDDNAFQIFRDVIFREHHKSAKMIKIPEAEVSKRNINTDTDAYVEVSFKYFVDSEPKTYQAVVKYDYFTYAINATFTDPAGKVTTVSDSVFGED